LVANGFVTLFRDRQVLHRDQRRDADRG
jgi:hypothetical protein